MSSHGIKNPFNIIVIVAALGYFVDIYDLVLFSILRRPSLIDLGISDADLLPVGVRLLNMQMGGLLIGGILWGMLGDKKGRVSVLFGSIFMYSIANIANGFVQTVETYAWLRLFAGIGLAGELGAGITLVSETMSKEKRGYGTMIVATVGICGAVAAALVGDYFHWRTAYFIGGGMGILLLLLRIGVYESGLYKSLQDKKISKGNFFQLFTNKKRFKKYISIILVGVPIWFVVGILITFSPEIGKAMGMEEMPNAGKAIMYCYIGLAIGDFASGFLSQIFKTRIKILIVFILLTAIMMILYFTVAANSLSSFYVISALLGFATGYWAVFITTAAEHFGTNIRATVTTTSPNFVRGAVVILTILFEAGRSYIGIINSAIIVGAITIIIALYSMYYLEETFGKNLDYTEDE
jgi:MFS transporter, putative metabolite:H+ symporter